MNYATLENTTGAHNVSDKYVSIPSSDILHILEDKGFHLQSINEARVKNPLYQGKQYHAVKFNLPTTQSDKDYQMNALWINSYNRSTSAKLLLGTTVFACSNGLVIADYCLSTRHIGHSALKFSQGIDTFLANSLKAESTIDAMKNTFMPYEKQRDFVQLALGLRWKELPKKIGQWEWENFLFSESKGELKDESVWEVYNNVQENLVRGRHGSFHFRSLKSVKSTTDINLNLWKLAKSYTI